MSMTVDQYVSSVDGKPINASSGSTFTEQCWDLVQDYINKVIGSGDVFSTQDGGHDGYAIGAYTGYANNGNSNYLTKLGPTANAPVGSIVFWNWGSSTAPDSHTAILLGKDGNNVKVLSQNSPQKYAAIQELPAAGIAGYLVPKNENNIYLAGDISNLPQANGSAGAPPLGSAVLQGIVDGLGLGNVISPGSSFIDGLKGFLTGLFLPATWVRATAGILGFILIIVGFTFIVKELKKNES